METPHPPHPPPPLKQTHQTLLQPAANVIFLFSPLSFSLKKLGGPMRRGDEGRPMGGAPPGPDTVAGSWSAGPGESVLGSSEGRTASAFIPAPALHCHLFPALISDHSLPALILTVYFGFAKCSVLLLPEETKP